MSNIDIDGKKARIIEGMTILEAARNIGISIPTLCHHEKLIPFGACRICIVEVDDRTSRKYVVSCATVAEDGWIVRTRTSQIEKYRRTLLELMLARAPHSTKIKEIAQEYGAKADKYEKDSSFCIHCGLCVRYCWEIEKKMAIGFIDRGVRKEICFIPEIALRECDKCKGCFPICPTSYLQAAYVLMKTAANLKEKENLKVQLKRG